MNDRTTARLRWSCRRGMRELDLWFNAYLENTYPLATRKDQQDFEQLLEFHDQDLFDWLMGNTQPTNKDLLPLIESIRLSANQPNNTCLTQSHSPI
jgi:antitoxin CptB